MRVRSNLSSATPEKVQVDSVETSLRHVDGVNAGWYSVCARVKSTSSNTRRQRGAWVVPSRHGTVQYSIRLACIFERLRRLFRPVFQAGKADVT